MIKANNALFMTGGEIDELKKANSLGRDHLKEKRVVKWLSQIASASPLKQIFFSLCPNKMIIRLSKYYNPVQIIHLDDITHRPSYGGYSFAKIDIVHEQITTYEHSIWLLFLNSIDLEEVGDESR